MSNKSYSVLVSPSDEDNYTMLAIYDPAANSTDVNLKSDKNYTFSYKEIEDWIVKLRDEAYANKIYHGSLLFMICTKDVDETHSLNTLPFDTETARVRVLGYNCKLPDPDIYDFNQIKNRIVNCVMDMSTQYSQCRIYPFNRPPKLYDSRNIHFNTLCLLLRDSDTVAEDDRHPKCFIEVSF